MCIRDSPSGSCEEQILVGVLDGGVDRAIEGFVVGVLEAQWSGRRDFSHRFFAVLIFRTFGGEDEGGVVAGGEERLVAAEGEEGVAK
eukprot:853058-Alexandrium_andersonii.AAC.1